MPGKRQPDLRGFKFQAISFHKIIWGAKRGSAVVKYQFTVVKCMITVVNCRLSGLKEVEGDRYLLPGKGDLTVGGSNSYRLIKNTKKAPRNGRLTVLFPTYLVEDHNCFCIVRTKLRQRNVLLFELAPRLKKFRSWYTFIYWVFIVCFCKHFLCCIC